MQLCVALTADDLTSLVEQITPISVATRPRRVISLGRPAKVALVAGVGLRVRGDARFTWDVGGVTIPVTLRAWQVLLVPSFVARGGGHVLAFDPVLEELDLKGVPMFLEGRIAQAVKDGLAAQRGSLAWDFEKHLSISRALPSKLSPSGELALAPSCGTVVVTDDEIRLSLSFAMRVRRELAAPAPPTSVHALRDAEATPLSERAAARR